MKDEEGQHAYRQAIRMLSRRALTRAELVQRLGKKGFDAAASQEAAERVGAQGFLDDEAIASRLAERYVLEKAYGRSRAAREMKRRLLDGEGIRLALDRLEERNPGSEEEALARSRSAWVSRHGEPADRAAMGRLAAHLQRRGFRDAMIRREVLDRYRHGTD